MFDVFLAWQQEAEKLKNGEITKELTDTQNQLALCFSGNQSGCQNVAAARIIQSKSSHLSPLVR